MPDVHLSCYGQQPSRWQVRVDGRAPEPFSCPIEALLRAKALYAQMDANEAAALLVDFHGHHETQLLPR